MKTGRGEPIVRTQNRRALVTGHTQRIAFMHMQAGPQGCRMGIMARPAREARPQTLDVDVTQGGGLILRQGRLAASRRIRLVARTAGGGVRGARRMGNGDEPRVMAGSAGE